jgi:protein-disulfide isomerase
MDTVKIVFKHYPLNFHAMARPAAEAGIAAANQGKFWAYHDLLYENYNSLSTEKFTKFAEKIGLDMAKFNRDLKSPATRDRLRQDMQAAQQAGVTGTPSIFINGRRVGKRTPENIQKMIDAELK